MNLQTSVQDVGRAYRMYAGRLAKLGIIKVEDFLYHLPFRYDDYSLISKIAHVQEGETVTIQGTVVGIKSDITKRRMQLQKATIADSSGQIDVVWFNQPFLLRVVHEKDMLSLAGPIKRFSKNLVMQSPDYEVITNDPPLHTARLVPVYSETRGITSKWLRRQVFTLLKNNKEEIEEFLPDDVRDTHHLPFLSEAIQTVHFPGTIELAEKARQRLAFDELLLLQLAGMQRRLEWKQNRLGSAFAIDTHKKALETFWENLPFTLTNAQRLAVDDMLKDLSQNQPMNRLLEGDVGSGKTVVGTIAMYLAHLNGFQSVLMAPTEILAQQHYATVSKLLEPLGVTVGLQTGSKKNKKISATDILIGTHAVLSKNVQFHNLGLVIIDEQQRFGVEQRAFIKEKGKNPHLLTMTATPIPRTVALTLYGDLDVSYLHEMPKNRKRIKTWLVPDEKRMSAYEWIRKQIKETGTQVFIICPFIEPSETMQTIKAATQEYEDLQKNIFPEFSVGLLHGKLKAKEKDSVLEDFRSNKYAILVATPVVEVGIDIPNANIMLIEASERFGLSQLHQLRGRVGRSDQQAYCLLFTESKNPHTIERLKAMEQMDNGAELAELDLKLRGPGDLYGTAQHGVRQLKIAKFSDFPLIQKAKHEAQRLFPIIGNYPLLQEKMKQVTIKIISPD